MPLFEYICPKCNIQKEILVRGSEEPVCPECGSPELVKLTSTFAPLGSSQDVPSCPSGGCCNPQGEGCPYS